jgi:hypothetical protein
MLVSSLPLHEIAELQAARDYPATSDQIRADLPPDDCSRTFRRPSLCRSTLVRSVDIACGSFKMKLRG